MNAIQSIINSSSLIRTKQVLDTDIRQLIFTQKKYINNITQFFDYYDDVKQDITRLQNNYSHQYLVNQCITKYPDDINIIQDNSYSFVIQNLTSFNTILQNYDYKQFQSFNKLKY